MTHENSMKPRIRVVGRQPHPVISGHPAALPQKYRNLLQVWRACACDSVFSILLLGTYTWWGHSYKWAAFQMPRVTLTHFIYFFIPGHTHNVKTEKAEWTSNAVIALFIFSISSSFSLGRLHLPKNLSISSRLSILLAQSCMQQSLMVLCISVVTSPFSFLILLI